LQYLVILSTNTLQQDYRFCTDYLWVRLGGSATLMLPSGVGKGKPGINSELEECGRDYNGIL